MQLPCAGVQSSRADKALAVGTLWDSLSLYINHCAAQAKAVQPSAPAAAAAASEPVNTQDALPVEQKACATSQEGPQVSLSRNDFHDVHCLSS